MANNQLFITVRVLDHGLVLQELNPFSPSPAFSLHYNRSLRLIIPIMAEKATPQAQESNIQSEHREDALATSEKASSTNIDIEPAEPQEIDFATQKWTLKDRIAALSLSGLYVGMSSFICTLAQEY